MAVSGEEPWLRKDYDHCSTASSSEDDDAISLEPPIAPRRSARVRARAAAQPASDVLSIVVCNGFPVVT